MGPPPSLLGATGGTGQDDQTIDPITGSRTVSPATTSIAEGACRWEKYSLLVRIFTARDRRSLKLHTWVEDLLKDFFQSILGINLSVVLLSPTECLIFCGNHTQGQGMSWDESLHYAHQLMGVHPWTGYMIEVVTHQRTLKEARHEMQVAREFTHERTKQRITHLNALAMAPAAKDRPAMPQRSPRGRGMMRRADRYFIQQQLGEMNLDEPPLCWALPCWVLNRRAPSVNSSILPWKTMKKKTAKPLVHWTRNSMPVRARRRNFGEFWRPKNRRLSFPLLQETTKEDAISYWDWCSEIEDALEHGHNAAKVKGVMFASLEGMARDNAKMIDENGDLHVSHILYGLDSVYGVSMTFQSLNAALCSLQQRQMESAHTYYNRMAQITVILRERHSNHYRPGELARMSKDCFYAGLLPENHPMVVHLKDQPHTTPLDLYKALLEQEENDALTHTRYPPSMLSRMS